MSKFRYAMKMDKHASEYYELCCIPEDLFSDPKFRYDGDDDWFRYPSMRVYGGVEPPNGAKFSPEQQELAEAIEELSCGNRDYILSYIDLDQAGILIVGIGKQENSEKIFTEFELDFRTANYTICVEQNGTKYTFISLIVGVCVQEESCLVRRNLTFWIDVDEPRITVEETR